MKFTNIDLVVTLIFSVWLCSCKDAGKEQTNKTGDSTVTMTVNGEKIEMQEMNLDDSTIKSLMKSGASSTQMIDGKKVTVYTTSSCDRKKVDSLAAK